MAKVEQINFFPPQITGKENWPPDYVSVWAWRQQQLLKIRKDLKLLAGAKAYYKNNIVEFILHWVDTYDPRNAGRDTPAKMPFVLFPKQAELIEFILALLKGEEDGLVEKCRDAGATWVGCSLSVSLWLLWNGAAIGWGSRKADLVDKIGDPDSIFEKMRMLIRGLPIEFLPKGWNDDDYMGYMKIINPENGSTITGEAGDNIGRGGRKLIYFKDESAHYERPEKIEAALGDNTRVQVDISSVNGTGNVFHRRREAGTEWKAGMPAVQGTTNVFIFDWKDHPGKTQEWYDRRYKKAEEDGLLHVFHQEVDRDYSASVEGVVIPTKYVSAAIDAHIKLGFTIEGMYVAGLDVADEGLDKHALALRKGPVLLKAEDRAQGDVGDASRWAFGELKDIGQVELQYDCIGVGAGVKAEANRLKLEGKFPSNITMVPWAASASVLNPKKHILKDENGDEDKASPTNGDYYDNLKAQGWWELRIRFEKTYRVLTEGVYYPDDELISLPSTLPRLHQIQKELSQATMSRSTRTLKLVINKAPSGTRSPNIADGIVEAYWPAPARKPVSYPGHVGS